MKDKISYALKKSKFVLIIVVILWLILSIVLIAPLSISWVDAVTKGNGNFINNLLNSNLGDIGGNLGKAFSQEYIGTFLKCDLWLIIILIGFAIVGIIKTLPKHDYKDIEHGSSDWSQRGEQYQILDRKKGIILAEDNYLPVDKRGNVNVLVVGRIRFW